MDADDKNTLPITDRRAFLWLVLAGVLGLFSFGDWTISLAPWLGILLSIRFMHSQPTLRGYCFLSLIRMGLAAVFVSQIMPSSLFPASIRYAVIILGSLSATLPYVADRLIAPHLKGVTATLIFPVTYTAWEFVTLALNPMGTFGALAYSQYGNLPLMQIVSVTGIAGLTFIITWFASTANWIWERPFSWPTTRSGGALFATVFGLLLLYGGARLGIGESNAGTMQVASFSLRGEGANLPALSRTDRAAFREKTRRIHDRYFAETSRQADSGAQLVLWPEAAGICASEDEAALITRGQHLAREKAIYLAMPLFTQKLKRNERADNKLIVVDPAGEVVMEHFKYGGNLFERSVLGNGVLTTFQTPDATVGGVICWDMDFPRIVSQSGRNGTDILLVPANDWKAVSSTHSNMAVFRAIENGMSLVRHAKNGRSIATDPFGRTLASIDHFTASERLMIAQVPTNGVTTVYSVTGDFFAWMTVIAFLFLSVFAVIESRRAATG